MRATVYRIESCETAWNAAYALLYNVWCSYQSINECENIWTSVWKCECSKESIYLWTYNITPKASTTVLSDNSVEFVCSWAPKVLNKMTFNACRLWMIDWELSSKCKRQMSCSSHGFSYHFWYLFCGRLPNFSVTTHIFQLLACVNVCNYGHGMITKLFECLFAWIFECLNVVIPHMFMPWFTCALHWTSNMGKKSSKR